MGESLLAVREFDQAELFLKKGLMVKPQMQPHVHALLGRVYAAKGQPRAAVAELNLGLQSDEDGSIHYQLALQYRKLGDEKASRSAMKESEALKLARLQRAHIALEDPATALDN
jgi:predicted Zn-dependent protease